jgi:sugar-specific transcriptional regulator TrmB
LSFQDHGEKIIRELGLTFSQARVYIALVRLGDPTTARAVSSFLNIARQDVYQLVVELQKLGIVELVIGKPEMFRAIPMQETVSILMDRRNRKTSALLSEATELLGRLPEKPEATIQQDNRQFLLIPEKEVLIHRIGKAIETAQKSIRVITPWKELIQWLLLLDKCWSQALRRDVTIQWVTEKQMNADSNPENIAAFLKNPRFKLKTVSNLAKKRLAIYDGKEVFIATLSRANAAESPALWTNNSVIIDILADYFEMKWKVGTKKQVKLIREDQRHNLFSQNSRAVNQRYKK